MILTISIISATVYFYIRRVSGLKREKRVQEAFSKELIDTQEKERKRIASELHDSIGQELLVINNEIKRFKTAVKKAKVCKKVC